jgi:PST family polysaccharide transporter
MRELKIKAVRGVFWAMTSSSLVQFLKLMIKIILARLLLPSDFGLFAIAILVITTLNLFQNLGIKEALIHRQKNIKKALNTSFFVILIFGFLLTLVGFFSASFVANFFQESLAEPIIKILSISFFIYSFNSIPHVKLIKELKFKKSLIPYIGSTFFFGITSIYLAFSGFGVWSLVFGYLADSITNVILYWVIAPFKPSLDFDWTIAKKLLGYGKHIVGFSISVFIVTNLDNAIVGKILGTSALGFYVLAYTISNIPVTRMTYIINMVAFPVYSILQKNKGKLKKAYLKVLKLTSLITIPAAAGIFILAPDLVNVLLGENWSPMIPVLKILCFLGLFRSVEATMGPVFKGIGKPKILNKIKLYQLILFLVLIFPLTFKFGVIGTAVAVTFVYFFDFILHYANLIRIIKGIGWEIALICGRFLIATLVMIILIFLLKTFVFQKMLLIHLIFLILIGGIVYIILSLLIDKNLKKEIIEIYKLRKKNE